jgi:hypothetical protein
MQALFITEFQILRGENQERIGAPTVLENAVVLATQRRSSQQILAAAHGCQSQI